MDAVEYLKERLRLCDEYRNDHTSCEGCPFGTVCMSEAFNPEESVRIVEEWSKAHPIQTNAQKFAEVFGYKPLHGSSDFICPPKNARKCTDCYAMSCSECKKWWDEPYRER